jgi:uncharacterized protein (TIGR00369 family)
MDCAAVFAGTPSNRFLGLRLLSRSAGRTEVELPLRAELLQEEGVVHGGFLATLADTAAVWLLWPDLGTDRSMTSIEFKVNFLGAGRDGGGPLRAVATLLRKGRTVAVCESEVLQDGRLVAKGTFTYLLRDRR